MKNELNLGISNEDVDKLTVSYYEPMSNEDLTNLQEENKTPAEAEDCKSHPTKTLTVKEMKETFNHHEHFLSMMEESDLNADGSSEVHRTTDWDKDCYRLQYQKKKSWCSNILLDSSSRKLVQCCQQVILLSSKSATYIWLDPCTNVLLSIGTSALLVAHTKGFLYIFKHGNRIPLMTYKPTAQLLYISIFTHLQELCALVRDCLYISN